MTAETALTDVPLEIHRLAARFDSDDRRVITLPFMPGGEPRIRAVLSRVETLSDEQVEQLLAKVMSDFSTRHESIESVLMDNYRQVMAVVGEPRFLSRHRQLLVGSYFTMEYSLESAALFNPSIVPHVDQTGLDPGSVRFIVSLRATGEGHVSSIVFRTGTIDEAGRIHVDPPRRFIARARLAHDQSYHKPLFRRKLKDLTASATAVDKVMAHLDERFTIADLDDAIEAVHQGNGQMPRTQEAFEAMRWLARSNYQLSIPPDDDISQIAIFPQSEAESRGIEDLRLVRFVDDDGSACFMGTYTAWNGYNFLPQLLETPDWQRISVHTLNGKCVQNKGMALFPRRIDGHYVMCGRLDGENLYIMYSDMLHFWESAELLCRPQMPWEFMQIGNCGSPIETDEGWLLLTHGVGPMRQYAIGAMLLDLDDPTRVIGHLSQPLLMPTEQERDGYVPNVVYSCGAMVHAGRLYIPYAMSDLATSFASVELDSLLARLRT